MGDRKWHDLDLQDAEGLYAIVYGLEFEWFYSRWDVVTLQSQLQSYR